MIRPTGRRISLVMYVHDLKAPAFCYVAPGNRFICSPPGGANDDWQRGLHWAEAQNLARELMETPSNLVCDPPPLLDATRWFSVKPHVLNLRQSFGLTVPILSPFRSASV